jgi:hypothetical protein
MANGIREIRTAEPPGEPPQAKEAVYGSPAVLGVLVVVRRDLAGLLSTVQNFCGVR